MNGLHLRFPLRTFIIDQTHLTMCTKLGWTRSKPVCVCIEEPPSELQKNTNSSSSSSSWDFCCYCCVLGILLRVALNDGCKNLVVCVWTWCKNAELNAERPSLTQRNGASKKSDEARCRVMKLDAERELAGLGEKNWALNHDAGWSSFIAFSLYSSNTLLSPFC